MINNFIKLINHSGSIYHSVEFIKEYLDKKGYGELNINNKFEIGGYGNGAGNPNDAAGGTAVRIQAEHAA